MIHSQSVHKDKRVTQLLLRIAVDTERFPRLTDYSGNKICIPRLLTVMLKGAIFSVYTGGIPNGNESG